MLSSAAMTTFVHALILVISSFHMLVIIMKYIKYILDFVPEVNCHVSSLVICKFAPHRYFYCFGQFDKFLFAVHLKAKFQLVD